MQPLHKTSFLPLAKIPRTWWKKYFRFVHTGILLVLAFSMGVGFSEGLILIKDKANKLIQSPELPVVINKEEKSGSNESNPILPISFYNIVGTPKYINSVAYLAGDVDTGEIILSKNSSKVLPIASVSKLTTAVIALDNFTSKQDVVVTKSALSTYGPSGGLQLGEKVKAHDLIYPLLLESSNDVAELISEQFGIAKFVDMMNKKVDSIGMKNTSYEEASGLSPKNVSTASDLFMLSKYIYNEVPQIWDITRIREFSIMKHTWNNYNFFLKDKTFVGGKNGYTDEALKTGLELFNLPIKTDKGIENRNIAIIVLHTDTREQDISKILDFLKKSVSLSK
jgi:D-alanyl-D-alanine carboxypeptidase